jgi:hypothetical protein
MTLQGTHFSTISKISYLGKLFLVLEGAARHKINPVEASHWNILGILIREMND